MVQYLHINQINQKFIYKLPKLEFLAVWVDIINF